MNQQRSYWDHVFTYVDYRVKILNWTPILLIERYMTRLPIIKDEHENVTCYDEVGLCAPNTITTLDSTFNAIGKPRGTV